MSKSYMHASLLRVLMGRMWLGWKASLTELAAGKKKRELGSPVEAIYLSSLDLSFVICTTEHLAH